MRRRAKNVAYEIASDHPRLGPRDRRLDARTVDSASTAGAHGRRPLSPRGAELPSAHRCRCRRPLYSSLLPPSWPDTPVGSGVLSLAGLGPLRPREQPGRSVTEQSKSASPSRFPASLGLHRLKSAVSCVTRVEIASQGPKLVHHAESNVGDRSGTTAETVRPRRSAPRETTDHGSHGTHRPPVPPWGALGLGDRRCDSPRDRVLACDRLPGRRGRLRRRHPCQTEDEGWFSRDAVSTAASR